MIPYFTFPEGVNTSQINFTHSVLSYDWGQSQDLENKSIITGKRNYNNLGDYAEIKMTVFLWKHTTQEQTNIRALRGQAGTLYTAIGQANFYVYSIQYNFYDNLDKYLMCTITFKSRGYV